MENYLTQDKSSNLIYENIGSESKKRFIKVTLKNFLFWCDFSRDALIEMISKIDDDYGEVSNPELACLLENIHDVNLGINTISTNIKGLSDGLSKMAEARDLWSHITKKEMNDFYKSADKVTKCDCKEYPKEEKSTTPLTYEEIKNKLLNDIDFEREVRNICNYFAPDKHETDFWEYPIVKFDTINTTDTTY